MPAAALFVAIFGFRLIYFACPAVVASARLVFAPNSLAIWRDPEPPHVKHLPRAETSVITQTGGQVEQLGSTFSALWPTGQALVALFDPMDAPDNHFFAQLKRRARNRNRFAIVYKCAGITAAKARAAGWLVLHSADDAILDVRQYTLDTPDRAGLRRKLRKATKAGITVREHKATDAFDLARVDAEWQREHGTARGGTMGRFCPAYLNQQRVYVAEQNGQIIAFASFHVTSREWTLDLLRYGANVPDGTMQSLVQQAIEVARCDLVERLSLAAVPACPDPGSAMWRAIMMRVVAKSRSPGLRQFKSSFAPRWEPRYVAAPSWVSMLIGLGDIAKEVFFPRALNKPHTTDVNDLHQKDENYELANKVAA